MNSKLGKRILTLRECSNVQRAHGIPHVGDYTVGKHSYDMLMLLLELWPDSSPELMKAVLLHDCAERWVGDIPCTACWDNGELRKAYRAAEALAAERNGVALPKLTEDEQFRLSLVDKLELFFWAHEQRHGYGNRNVDGCIDKLTDWFHSFGVWGKVPGEVAEIIMNYNWRRL